MRFQLPFRQMHSWRMGDRPMQIHVVGSHRAADAATTARLQPWTCGTFCSPKEGVVRYNPLQPHRRDRVQVQFARHMWGDGRYETDHDTVAEPRGRTLRIPVPR